MARTFDLEEPVGRDEELALADELLRATLADTTSRQPHARALLISGDAGMGKTTLVHALESRASALGLGFTVGHCLDLATGLPLGPVVEALRSHVHRNVSDPAALSGSATWLASAPPSAAAGSVGKLLDAAESLAEVAPFVLVLEDLHWADESVRSWALAVLRTCRAPLLLGLTYRTEELARHHPLRPVLVELGRSPGSVRLELPGLDAKPIAELGRRRTGRELDLGTIASLVERSEGNPLFVEELLDAHGDGVPGPLHDLLLRHVDRLTAPSARLARLASVGGSIVDLDVLQDASGLTGERFSAALQEILDGNVIVRRGDRFSFRHALLREAIHDELLPRERAEMHAALARALRTRVEAGSTAERWQYGAALALHAYAAHDVPLTFDASVWAGLAGKQYGAGAAADHFERALELWDQVPDAAERSGLARTDLPRLAAKVLANEGARARVHALLRQAVDLLPVDGDPLAASRVYTAIGNEWIQVSGVLDQGEALDRAIALAGATPTRELAEALVAAAFHESRMLRFGVSLTLAQRALDVAAVLGAVDLVPEARWEEAGALWDLGRCDEALEVHRAAVHDAEQSDQPGLALEIAGELAGSLLRQGQTEDGLELARRTRAAAQTAGLPRLVAFAAEQEAEWLIQDGEFAVAEALYDDACLPARQTYRDCWFRVRLLLARGDGVAAAALEEETIAEHQLVPGIDNTPRLIEAYEQLGDVERVLSTTEAMLLEVAATDSPLVLARAACHGLRARALAAVGGLAPSAELVRRSADALAFARSHSSAEWDESWSGLHLAIATAHDAQLLGRPAIVQWRRAVALGARHGRYTALQPRLELARALLAHTEREEGKELLVATWHEAHAMGARRVEKQAAHTARRFRVTLPLDGAGPGPLNRLTPREREVLELVATGATDRVIATTLFITEKTASAHVGRVLAKLGVSNRGQAAAVARSAQERRDQ
jgi:DNA-binding CsgD family transcriptional regulator/tetratricopeptide (TPR) repeat protein